MNEIDSWFKKRAEESLKRKPWRECRADDELRHLTANTGTAAVKKKIIIYFIGALVCAPVAFLGVGGLAFSETLYFNSNATFFEIIANALAGLSLIIIGVFSYYMVIVAQWRSMIAHQQLLDEYKGDTQ